MHQLIVGGKKVEINWYFNSLEVSWALCKDWYASTKLHREVAELAYSTYPRSDRDMHTSQGNIKVYTSDTSVDTRVRAKEEQVSNSLF